MSGTGYGQTVNRLGNTSEPVKSMRATLAYSTKVDTMETHAKQNMTEYMKGSV